MSDDAGERLAAGPDRAEAARVGTNFREGPMTEAQTSDTMSTELRKVAERARRDPDTRFHSLAHLIDQAALRRTFHRQRGNAAAGVDGVTKADYEQELETHLQDLHERLRTRRYRHQPIRRVHIPKEGRLGQTRPIGISCFEDKLVQGALREVLEAVYEPLFRDCSYGFRSGRSAHDAVRKLQGLIYRGEVNWILESDVQSFFDDVDRPTLRKMLQERIADGSIHRLVGKCLHVGVLDGTQYVTPDQGTTQGSGLSPMLGNIYLHYVLDTWFEDQIRPRLKGRAHLIRYADDFVLGFELQEDAERVMGVLSKRMERFGLRLQPDKTRLVSFQRPPRTLVRGKASGTFDLLGFTWYMRRSRRGNWVPACMTRKSRRRRIVRNVSDWCRRHRHEPVAVQHAALVRRIRGHFQYFGVNGNARSLGRVVYHAERAWYKWLKRRSQRSRLNWDRFEDLLRDFPLPRPRVYVNIWG